MSDDYIILIPEDPRYVPDAARQERARARMGEIAPEADEVTLQTTETIEFFSCVENFERVLCPSCGEEISVEWWQERMDEDYGDGFKLASYAAPCCGAVHTLHELRCEWPQGFGRFALEAMNPNLGRLDDKHKRAFEELLGTPLRVVYVHM